MAGQKKKSLASYFKAASLALALMQGNAVWAGDEVVQESPQVADGTAFAQDVQVPAKSSYSLQLDPLIHPAIVLGGGAGLALLILACAGGRKTKGATLRAASVMAFSGLLMNPELVAEKYERLPSEVAIVIDKSDSQTLAGRDKSTAEAYRKVLDQLSGIEGINIRTIEISAGDESSQGAGGTHLFSSLDRGLADVPRDRLGGVIVITDGQVHDVPQSVKDRMGEDAPLHVMVTGHDKERDRNIVIEKAPQFGIVGQKQKIIFRVSDKGDISDTDAVRVTLHDGKNVVGTKIVVPGETAEMEIDIGHIGKNTFELKADTLSGEITDINNRVVVSTEGIRESLSVLLVTNQPYMGTRALRSIMKADPDIDAIDYKIIQTPEKIDYTPLRDKSLVPFPTHELFHSKLKLFDLVVFDSYQYSAILPSAYFNNLARYTKEGGALLVISGDEYSGGRSLYNTLMQPIFPAIPTGQVSTVPYKPVISETGRLHPVTRGLDGEGNLESPVWGRWSLIVDSNVVSGQALMKGPEDKPLLILDRQEKGRVAMLQSNNAWLWAHNYDGGGPYADLMRRTIQWLIKNPDMEEEALRMVVEDDGNIIIERQTMSDVTSEVTVTTPSGEQIQVMPEDTGNGIWRTKIKADEYGLYRAEQKGTQNFVAHTSHGPADPEEYINVVSTLDILKPAVQETGGSIKRIFDDSGNISIPEIVMREAGEAMDSDGKIGLRMSKASILKGMDQISLAPAMLLLLLGAVAATYLAEGGSSFFRRKKKTSPSEQANVVPKKGM